MSGKIISKTIHLLPSDMNKNLLEKITSEVAKLQGSCDSENGYIVKVHPNTVKDLNIVVSSTGKALICHLTFTGDTLLPQVGDEYDAKVVGVFSHSVVAQIQGVLNVIITGSKMTDHVYSQEQNCFLLKGSKKKGIRIGDTIRIQIEAVSFSKKKYNCVAHLL